MTAQGEAAVANRGRFDNDDWKHVSGVAILDYVRGAVELRYYCTVLANPAARVPLDPGWFPAAKVAVCSERSWGWVGGEPGDTHTLADGTHTEES